MVTDFFNVMQQGSYADIIVLIVAIAGGLMLAKWRYGFAVAALATLAVFAAPVPRAEAPFSFALFKHSLFWIAIALAYARYFLAFTLGHSLRNLIDYAWREVRRRIPR